MAPAAADDLAGIPLFDTLEPDERAAIARWFELDNVSPGVKLTGEGASAGRIGSGLREIAQAA
jgi:hypothetical protein